MVESLHSIRERGLVFNPWYCKILWWLWVRISVPTYSVALHKLSPLCACHRENCMGLHPGKDSEFREFREFTLPTDQRKQQVSWVTISLSQRTLFLEGRLGNCPCVDRNPVWDTVWSKEIRFLPEVLKSGAFALLTVTFTNSTLKLSVWVISFNLYSLPWGEHYYNNVSIPGMLN